MITVAIKLFHSALLSIKPSQLIKEVIQVSTNRDVTIKNAQGSVTYGNKTKFQLIGFGKAVLDMAIQVECLLKTQLISGILSIPYNSLHSYNNLSTKLQIFESAAGNIPDVSALHATSEILNLVREMPKDNILLILISGGGSSLFCKPVSGLSLEDKLTAIRELVKAGADINDLNCVRKKLSDVKGGKFLSVLSNIKAHCFILSDVIGDKLSVIASGPTVQNEDASDAALNILTKFNVLNKVPTSVQNIVRDSSVFESISSLVDNTIIGSNKVALIAAKNEAEKLGFQAHIMSSEMAGLVPKVAENLSDFTKHILQFNIKKIILSDVDKYCKMFNFFQIQNIQSKNQCFLFGGETTVEVIGSGSGGRNQELAVWFSKFLVQMKKENPELFKDFEVTLLSAGTDGIDGSTDVAGCVGCCGLLEDGEKLGLNVDSFLANNDTYTYISNVARGKYFVRTGHTGTNVMDLQILLVTRK